MKRLLGRFLLTFVAATAVLAPVGWSSQAGMVSNVAVAASPAPSGGDCVNLSVQVKTGQNQVCPGSSGNVIITYLVLILQFAGSALGGVIVLMLIIAGIQYITAAGDPGAVKAAKNRIINAITALVLFLFMFAILNFLIPGGIFT